MTIETGSKRHGRYVSEAVAVPAYPGDPATVPGEPVWETYRTLDPIRAAALANAVDLIAGLIPALALGLDNLDEYTLTLARTFETYLAGGEEAHGQA